MTAVPANSPNPSFVMPSRPPKEGKIKAAITLNRKITEIDWAISSSSAPMTGAVAAMAEPPQIEEPTPTSVEILEGIFNSFCMIKAITSDVVIVERIIGKDCSPTLAISDKFMPKPSKITAYCKIFLEVKVMPPCNPDLSLINKVITIPARIANTGPPITGSSLPRYQQGNAITRHRASP